MAGAEHAVGTERRSAKERRREVDQRLLALGLERSTREELPTFPEPERDERVGRFRRELESLGPLLSRFGLYCSTRLDHLPAEDCRELAVIADEREAASPDTVIELLRQELGASGVVKLGDFDPDPMESRLLSQTHRARRPDGRRLTVKIARPGRSFEGDLDLLPELSKRIAGLGWPLSPLRSMIDDFRLLVERELDLIREATVLERLRKVPTEAQQFGLPRVVRQLSSKRVLSLEPPPGSVFEPPPAAPSGTTEAPVGPVRNLADLWMYLVFSGHWIPEEMGPQQVLVSNQGVMALGGGIFTPIPSTAADTIWLYLVAAAGDDPDGVFEALVALSSSGEASRLQPLRHRLRHVVPRRDGRFGSAAPGILELLLAHWREMARHGLQPSPPLLAFFRGLVALREVAGPVLSDGIFREAFRVTQILRGSGRFRELMMPPWLPAGAEGYVEMLIDLPRRLDRSLLGPESTPETPPPPPTPAPRQPLRGWQELVAILLLATTVVLWSHRLPDVLGDWTPMIDALALALVGFGLLRAIWRH